MSIGIPGTVDSSPIFVGGRFVVTTSYGKTLALDRNGHILWTYTPPGIDGWEGSAQITNASPAADPDGKHVYAVSPDGVVHKLNLADGSEVTGGGWPVTITRDPTHEKLGTALNISGGSCSRRPAATSATRRPTRATSSRSTGRAGEIVHVWNSLCSDRHEIIDPSTCPDSDSAIWARAGAVVEPGTGRILVATGNAPYDGKTAWGDSVLELSPDAGELVGELDAAQPGGAELRRRRPRLDRPGARARCRRTALRHPGREGCTPAPHRHRADGGGADAAHPGAQSMFTAPAVLGRTVFIATAAGTAAYRLTGSGTPRLLNTWSNDTAGTSPVIAGGLVYVYDPTGGGINIYRPGSPDPVATLAAEAGHWQSPIAIDGCVLVGEGDANEHVTSGTLSLSCLP